MSLQRPQISIIVPVYRSEAYLRDCIRSIQAQTFGNWECILVDDGSPDGSGALCDEAAQADSRIRAVHQKNSGVSAARNRGLDEARGEHILFCDADDCIAPTTMETALAAQRQNPRDLICWLLCRKKEELVRTEGLPPESTAQKRFSMAQKQVYITTIPGHSNCNKLFSAQLIQQANLRYRPEVTMAEDYDFGTRYLQAFFENDPEASVLQLELCLYYWRENPQSATHKRVKAPKGAKVLWDPRDFPHCAEQLAREYRETRTATNGWQNLTEEELLPQLRSYLRRFAFSVWTAHQLGEPLPQDFFTAGPVQEILALLKEHTAYSPYYVPFRLQAKGLLRRLYQSDESGVKRLYRLCYTLGYYTLALTGQGRWKQP